MDCVFHQQDLSCRQVDRKLQNGMEFDGTIQNSESSMAAHGDNCVFYRFFFFFFPFKLGFRIKFSPGNDVTQTSAASVTHQNSQF